VSSDSGLRTDVIAPFSASWIRRLKQFLAVNTRNRTVNVVTNLLTTDCAVYETFNQYEPIGNSTNFLGLTFVLLFYLIQ
jgi:hypothetical protein